MTTIAWDGTTLAADSCSWSGGARRRVRKVFKVKAPDGQQFLVAFAGSGSFAVAVLGWMRGERDRPDHPDNITTRLMRENIERAKQEYEARRTQA